jgi:hypothetical protein
VERRGFFNATVGAGLALAGTNLFASGSAVAIDDGYDAKGLPTTMFGSTSKYYRLIQQI